MNPQLRNDRLRKRYEKLADDDKRRVDRGYERHKAACEKSSIKPDPNFTFELVIEAESGR